jgi:predicted nucleotidyltransferase
MAKFRIYNEDLCPDLWDSAQRLDPKIRLNLLQLARDFYEKTKFSAPIIDVYLMGSMSNYNWTANSDVDVHIIINYQHLKMPIETAEKSVKIASTQWNFEHNVFIKGHKVEMNIQNSTEKKLYVMGIYSLMRDQWVRKPFKIPPHINRDILKFQYKVMKDYILNAIASKNQEKMMAVKKYLDAYRQYGLDTNGELSYENIIFKILRSRGIIKQLKDSIIAVYDQKMSVNEGGKVTDKDVSSILPNFSQKDSPEFGDPKFDRSFNDKWDETTGEFKLERLTTSELKALREKAYRMALGLKKQGHMQWAKQQLEKYVFYDKELHRRLDFINSPIIESPVITRQGKIALSDNKPLKNKTIEDVNKNIVVIRQGAGGGLMPEGWTLVYFMDSEESAQAMKRGEIPYLMVPRGTGYSGGNPITDIWQKRFQKRGTEHILGVLEGHSDNKTVYIDMITVRPGWKRNRIATLMIDSLKRRFPESQILTSSQTEDGQKLFKTTGGKEFHPDDKKDENRKGQHFSKSEEVSEGYGAGIPEEDRLKIKNSDGSVRRWQIRSKDAPKTPKLTEEEEIKSLSSSDYLAESLLEQGDFKQFNNQDLYVGAISTDTYKVYALCGSSYKSDIYFSHGDLFKKYPFLTYENANCWSYRKDLNKVYWWDAIPDQKIKDEVDYWISQNTPNKNPKHVVINPRESYDELEKNWTESHPFNYINESRAGINKREDLYLGSISPENYKIYYLRCHPTQNITYFSHADLFQTYPFLRYEETKNWRYRADLNTVYWWNDIPDQKIKDELDYWVSQNTPNKNPKHVVINPISGVLDDDYNERKTSWHFSHPGSLMEVSKNQLNSISEITGDIKQQMADAAQRVYDEWKQDEEGVDIELGTGGICHIIADELIEILFKNNIYNLDIQCSDQPHVYLIGKFKEGIFVIDIPYYVYESGGGFSWKKKPGVKFNSNHVIIYKLDEDTRQWEKYVTDYD